MKNFFLKQVVVWLLIVMGLIIFSFFAYIITINKSSFLVFVPTYKTYLKESEGIMVGSKVTIHGVNTGNIFKTNLMPNGHIEVWFSVRRHHAFAVTKSSVVQLKNSGALGDRFINIFSPDLSAPPLEKKSLIPYKESVSLLSILTSSEGGVNTSLQDIIRKINSLLKTINKKGVVSVLSSNHQRDLTQILKSTKNILKKVESGQGTLGALINDQALYNRLLLILGQRPSKNYLEDLSSRSQRSKKSRR